MPNCKYCKVELEFEDTVDEYADDDIVIFYEKGQCPNCKRKYEWQNWPGHGGCAAEIWCKKPNKPKHRRAWRPGNR